MSGLKDDRGRIAGIVLAVILVAVAIAATVYEMRVAPPPPAPAPVGTPAPSPAAPPAPAAEDCIFPGPVPALPRGEVATAADMKIQHDAIQGFVKALETYQLCLNRKAETAPPDTDEQTKQRWVAEGNRAIDDAHALADAYAAQLKLYHEKHPEPLPEK